ncbi:hypothetical protein W822_17360 [Advenella kashmirensis W13003]|uniref:DUF2806 domain-containing protein n=1 Tax=Advenella kashmirensis W13003 TaxID=1424334 RepID=V8QN32_9BURK|nr:DUF2806 domain-containing protein [Advenella kashmirensis]ETF01391.1 hypothetical protein W822_17360 [Advenella kashmirensis W13003]
MASDPTGGIIATIFGTAAKGLDYFGSAAKIRRDSPELIKHNVANYIAMEAAKDHVERLRQGLIEEQLKPDGRKEPYIYGLELVDLNQKADALQKEMNVSKSVQHALEVLQQSKSEPTEEQIDPDWSFKWKDYASHVSSDEMRMLWGKILAGELERPGRFSFNTLHVMSRLGKNDAEIFLNLASLATWETERAFLITEDNIFYEYGVPYLTQLELEDLGLLLSAGSVRRFKDGYWFHIGGGQAIVIKNKGDKTPEVHTKLFTQAGRELLNLVQADANLDYFQKIGACVANKLKCEFIIAKHIQIEGTRLRWSRDTEIRIAPQ